MFQIIILPSIIACSSPKMIFVLKWQNAGNDVGIKKDFTDDGLETLLLQLFFEFTYITCNNVMFMLNGHNRRKTFFIIEAI